MDDQKQEPLKVIQPSAEVEEEARDNLINVENSPASERENKSSEVKVLDPDELDKANAAAVQKANELIAEDEIKNLPDRNDLSDDPYVHNSTEGFGASPGMAGYSLFRLFPNNRSQRILTVLLIVLAIIGLIIKYAHYL
ncbi:MAG: hypothetical protein ACHQT9_02695 [Candidatus Saccharimonadales bacterium]